MREHRLFSFQSAISKDISKSGHRGAEAFRTVRGTKRKLRRDVWEVRVSLGKDPVTGKYGRLSKTVRGSAKDADDALRDLITNRVPLAKKLSERPSAPSSTGGYPSASALSCPRPRFATTAPRSRRRSARRSAR